MLTRNVAEQVHDLRLIRARSPLVDDRQFYIESLRIRARPLRPSGVRRHNNDIVRRLALLDEPFEKDRRRVQVVKRNIEKTLDLAGVEVHCKKPLFPPPP